MANIRPYDPGDLPNRAVGTPGVNPSAGQAEEALAKGATNIRDAEAALATKNATLLGEVVGMAGRLVGKEIAAHRAATNLQKQQMATAAQVADGHRFAATANETLREYKDKYKDAPEQIETAMNDWLDKTKDRELRKYEDPVMRAKAAADYEGTITSIKNDAGKWSLDKQYDQAAAMVPNMVTAATNSISEHTGDIAQRMQNFVDQNKLMAKGIQGMQPLLGAAATSKALNAGLQDTSAEFMGNLVNERPSTPLEALQHLSAAKTILQGSVSMGLNLREGDKHRFAGQIEAAERYELKEIQLVESANITDFELSVGDLRVKLDLHHDNPVLQQQALDWAATETKRLQGGIQSIRDNPTLPPEAKDIMNESALKQFKALDQVVRVAHANQQYQLSLKKADEAEKRRDAAESRRIRHEAERDLKAAKAKEKEDAKADLKMNEIEAKTAINDALNEFQKLAVEPTKNRDQLIKLQSQIEFMSRKARDAGYIDPDKAGSYMSRVNNIGLKAANYNERPALGFFGPPTVTKNKKVDDQVKARASYESAVSKDLAALQAARKVDARVELAGLSPEGQAEYKKWAAQIEASDMAPAHKTMRLNQLMSKVQHDYPKR